ncbi:unnamed protein product, partial [Polarella glacialis]
VDQQPTYFIDLITPFLTFLSLDSHCFQFILAICSIHSHRPPFGPSTLVFSKTELMSKWVAKKDDAGTGAVQTRSADRIVAGGGYGVVGAGTG